MNVVRLISAHRSWRLLALVGASLAALTPLAFLQYRWIGRASEAEGERLRSHLATAARGFHEEFDQTIGRTGAALLSAPAPRLDEDLPLLAAEVERRLSVAGAGSLASALHLARASRPGKVELLELSSAASRVAPWPEDLIEVRRQLEAASVYPPDGAAPTAVIHSGEGILVVPRLPAGPRGRGPGPRGMGRMFGGPHPGMFPGAGLPPFADPPRAWWVVRLNLDFLREKVLPEMAARWFAPAGDLDLVVRIVADPSGTVLFASDPSVSAGPFSRPDHTETLLLPPETAARPFAPLARALPRTLGGLWVLQVANRAAPLADVLAATRRRNLAFSAGVLLILAASLVAVILAARRAQQLARLQMEFVAGVSHELRTPLSVIVSAADNLASGAVNGEEQVRKYGGVLRDEGRRLNQMLDHVLSYARLQSGRWQVDLQAHEAGALAAAAVELSGSRASVELPEGRSCGAPRVLADRAALTQVLRNLLDNAVTHGAPPVRLVVQTENGRVRFDVLDSGPGLDHAPDGSLFDPFVRGARAASEQRRGSGLGLALVRRLVTAQGGSVEAANRPEGGARFTIYLPSAPSA